MGNESGGFWGSDSADVGKDTDLIPDNIELGRRILEFLREINEMETAPESSDVEHIYSLISEYSSGYCSMDHANQMAEQARKEERELFLNFLYNQRIEERAVIRNGDLQGQAEARTRLELVDELVKVFK